MLAAIIGGAIAPAAKAVPSLYNCLCLQISYIRDIDENYEELQKEVTHLENRRTDVNTTIIRGARAQKMPTKECEHWRGTVEETLEKVNKLETKYQKAKSCLCGCPFWSRLNLSKKIVKMTMEVNKVIEGKPERGILAEKPPIPVQKKDAYEIRDVPSVNDVIKKILEWLRDDNVKRIGIWGLPGVGKTTIMENLNDMMDGTRLFEIVIWVTVSKKPTVREIQQAVVQRLKLNVRRTNRIDQLAMIISEELKSKKYLLLLDEVHSVVNLHDAGIRDNHEGGRVILTARCRNVCDAMGTDEDIYVKGLSKDEAWELFKKKVGDIVNHPRIEPCARLVAKECGALPQLIAVVAGSLKKIESEDLWRGKLIELQSPPTSQTEHKGEVLEFFKFGYNQLQDADRKNCLLYGALYPEDHEIYIDYLVECWRAEGFINCQKLREAREIGSHILEDLIDRSLLERSRKLEYVKMPALFRGQALRTIPPNEEGYRLLVKAGEEKQVPPTEEEWLQVKRISLMYTQLCTLPERPDCCMLSTLLLQKNSELVTVPNLFFSYMCNLRVLDLHGTRIESLPLPYSSLMNLKGLYLNVCSHLKELPPQIKELKNLELLDIRRTGINSLPIQIGELTGLRCLRMSFTDVGNHNHIQSPQTRALIPRNVIPMLSLLEELSIDVEPHDQRWDKIVDYVAEEVASLKQLSILHFYFPRVDCFGNFIKKSESWNNQSTEWKSNCFRSFNFLVGPHYKHTSHGLNGFKYPSERYLRFSGGESNPPAIPSVLNHVGAFELVDHHNVQYLSQFDMERMKGLKVCLIEGCKEIESIISGSMISDKALPFLENLHLINLPKLESIWEGLVQSGSLAKLTTLTLTECPKFKKIFSRGIISLLSKLQILRVENCSVIVEIIIEAENEILESNALPKLKTLQLLNLPELSRICPDATLDWPSLEQLKISNCDKLKNLPLRMDNCQKLRVIEGEGTWWSNLDWKDVRIKDQFRSLCHLT